MLGALVLQQSFDLTDEETIQQYAFNIKSNMRRLGRIGIFSESIHKLLVNLKRSHPDQFDTVAKKLIEKYLALTYLGQLRSGPRK